jgi:hypothetical protein
MFRRRVDVPISGIARALSATKASGVDIDLSEARIETKVAAAPPDRGWLESSRDLFRGVRVVETSMDMLPDEVVNEFLAAKHLRSQR